jgi:hypothetical protein
MYAVAQPSTLLWAARCAQAPHPSDPTGHRLSDTPVMVTSSSGGVAGPVVAAGSLLVRAAGAIRRPRRLRVFAYIMSTIGRTGCLRDATHATKNNLARGATNADLIMEMSGTRTALDCALRTSSRRSFFYTIIPRASQIRLRRSALNSSTDEQ